ncbi:MAG: hypothetical protein WEE89_17585 [Gemmatimonadota bacterium]
MSDLKRVSEIEINQDLDFQRVEWRIQRIGWVFIVIIALASIAGAFGGGPLAHQTRSTSSGDLVIEYDRIARHAAITRFDLHTPRAQGEVGVVFSTDYLHQAELRTVMPEPDRTESGAGNTTFYFNLEPNATVSFVFEPDDIGLRTIQIGLRGGSALRLKQFVLP